MQIQKQKCQLGHESVGKEQVSDFLSRMFDDILAEELSVPTMKASEKIVTPLLDHQREALAWMVQRENNSVLPPFWEPHKVCLAAAAAAWYRRLVKWRAPWVIFWGRKDPESLEVWVLFLCSPVPGVRMLRSTASMRICKRVTAVCLDSSSFSSDLDAR